MSKISIYQKVTDTYSKETLLIDQFIHNLQNSEQYQSHVIDVRSGRKDKRECPNVTISGTFEKRFDKDLKEHSGFICIDIDKEDPELVKLSLSGNEYVYCVFTSISGNGAAVIFKINPEKHREAFENISKMLFEQYGFISDQSCKNVSRARFISYDPNLYYNPKAKKWTIYKVEQPKKIERIVYVKSDFDGLINQLVSRNVDLTDSYSDWVKVGFAISDKFGESGRSYFHLVSQINHKYKSNQCDKQYDNILKAKGHGITIATFYWMCKQAGLDLYSQETKKIIDVTKHGKKIGKTKDQIKEDLKAFEGLEDPDNIIDQTCDTIESIKVADNIIDNVANEIRAYNLRRNDITRNLEKPDYSIIKETDLNTIFLSIKKEYEKLDFNLFNRIVMSDYTSSYNPFKEFFANNQRAVKHGSIDKFFNHIKTDTGGPDYNIYFAKKWYVSIVASMYGEFSNLVYVLSGSKQGTGKTTLFRQLLPKDLRSYYAESKLDAGKDDDILMTQKILIMDDEFGGKSKKEVSRFKELTSKQVFSLREPYGRNNVDLRRLAVMCGTTNDDQVLHDPTGNRRIIPINVLEIDYDKQDQIDRTDMLLEAKFLYESGFDWRINGSDIDRLNVPLDGFMSPSMEYELILKYYKVYDPEIVGVHPQYYTTSEIKSSIEQKSGQRLSLNKIGMELKSRLKAIKKSVRIDGSVKTCWLLIERQNLYGDDDFEIKSDFF